VNAIQRTSIENKIAVAFIAIVGSVMGN